MSYGFNDLTSSSPIKEADLGLVPVAISLERYEAIEFSGLEGGDFTGILVKYPTASISYTSTYDVFTIGVKRPIFYFLKIN